jgi:hypothetical protein
MLDSAYCYPRFSLNLLLALIEEPELRPLVCIDDGEDLGNSLADVVDARKLGVV